MTLLSITKFVNTLIAGEQLTFDRLVPYLDSAVDDINNALSSSFPAFSSIAYDASNADRVQYTAIPDRYIRSVVCYGAAHKFFLIDEEGVDSAPDIGAQYRTNLFYMTRDYIDRVPSFYQDDSTGGVIINVEGQIGSNVDMKGFL